jgi:hypothetical protein
MHQRAFDGLHLTAIDESEFTPGGGVSLASITTLHIQASLAVTPDWTEQLRSQQVETWEAR